MTPENFTYWLKGYFELTKSNKLTQEQVELIRKHLDLVHTNVTTSKSKAPEQPWTLFLDGSPMPINQELNTDLICQKISDEITGLGKRKK